MSRQFIAAAAQMGPIPIGQTRGEVVGRLIELLRESASKGARLVVFPEAALTPFFPHWLISDQKELDSYFEREMPAPHLMPLFDEARRLEVGFYLGYAELTESGEHFNSAVLVSPQGVVIGKYRKIHLPGFKEPDPGMPFQNLEKRYFDIGDLGFNTWPILDTTVGMCICNDRRWCETYRVLALRGAELVVLGYNTPQLTPNLPEIDPLVDEHNHLSMRAGAYQNGIWVIGTAKAGTEEGVSQIGGSCIIAPSGEVVAAASTLGDEVITAHIDLDQSRRYRDTIFNFAAHRRSEHYGEITSS